jgi:hypothetical protein
MNNIETKDLFNQWLIAMNDETQTSDFVLQLFDIIQKIKRENQFLQEEVNYWRKNSGF